MMMIKPPTSSLAEDLRGLGMLSEEAPTAAGSKANDTLPKQGSSKPSEQGYDDGKDSEAYAERHNVVVRDDKKGQADPAANNDGPAKAEDNETAYTVNEGKLPPFLAKMMMMKKHKHHKAMQHEAEQAAQALLGRSFDLIGAYHAAPDDRAFSADELHAVVEAYSIVADEYDTMLESVSSDYDTLYRSLQEAAAAEGDEDEDEDDKGDEDEDEDEGAPKHKAKAKAKDDDDKDDEGDEAEQQDESIAPSLSLARRVLSEGRRPSKKSPALDGLLKDLRSLTESTDTASSTDDHARIIEGFETVRDTCVSYRDQIFTALSDEAGVQEGEELELDTDDERVKLGAYFEGIATDSSRILTAIVRGEFDDSNAMSDLATLHQDLEKGVAKLQQI